MSLFTPGVICLFQANKEVFSADFCKSFIILFSLGLCLAFSLCLAPEIFSFYGSISSNQMKCFLSLLHTTRSGRCIVVTIWNINMGSNAAFRILEMILYLDKIDYVSNNDL